MNKRKRNLYGLAITVSLIVMTILPILWQGHELYIYMAMTVVVSTDSLLIWHYYLKKRDRNVWFYLMHFIVLYLVLIGSVYLYGEFLKYKLSLFDINGDSFFSKNEQTPEQIRYFEILTNDLSRNLMVFTGAIYAFMSTIVLSIAIKIYRLYRR